MRCVAVGRLFVRCSTVYTVISVYVNMIDADC